MTHAAMPVATRSAQGASGLPAGPCICLLLLAGSGTPVLAQGYASPHGASAAHGQPYTPPWQAGARERRPLDGSLRRPAPEPRPVHLRPPAIWQGLYLGAHGGFATGRLTDRDFDEAIELSGGALGLHAGYNAQLGRWVVGLEADGTWSGLAGRRDYGVTTVDGLVDWKSSLRLRAGYAIDNVLLYVTGGAAFAGVDLGLSDALLSVRSADTFLGYAVGGGVEVKFAPNVSGRLEALHYGFADRSLQFPMGSVPLDLSTTTIRAGLTYHFN